MRQLIWHLSKETQHFVRFFSSCIHVKGNSLLHMHPTWAYIIPHPCKV